MAGLVIESLWPCSWQGVSPETFALAEHNNGSGGFVARSKTFAGQGSLPDAPSFNVDPVVTLPAPENGPASQNK